MEAIDLTLIACGGAIGAMARWLIGIVQARLTMLPGWTAVLATNLAGCLVIGLAAGWHSDNPWVQAFIMTGLCGALTTFSAFALDCALMVLGGARAAATLCIALSLGLGIPLVLLGEWIVS